MPNVTLVVLQIVAYSLCRLRSLWISLAHKTLEDACKLRTANFFQDFDLLAVR